MIILNNIQSGCSECSDFDVGLYTYDQLNTLITVDGYIPVASGAELNTAKSDGAATMGTGTCWEDSYTISRNSKFVQVRNIDMTAISWTASIGIESSAIYDGNELTISNLTSTAAGLFGASAHSPTVRNVRGATFSVTVAANAVGLLMGKSTGGTYTNNTIAGDLTANQYVGGLIGEIIGAATISDCHYSGTLTSNTSYVGGIVGYPHLVSGGVTIADCTSSGTISTVGDYAGGIASYVIGCDISGCSSSAAISAQNLAGGVVARIEADNHLNTSTFTGTVTVTDADSRAGGIAAIISNVMLSDLEGCTVNGATISGSPSNSSSGLAGIVAHNSGAGNVIRECKVLNTTVIDTGTGFFTGGIIARDLAAVTIIDCYVDENSLIDGVQRVGGLGGNIGNASSVVTNSYSAAVVTATGSFVGGMIGQGGAATINASYWDTDTSGQATSAGGTGQTTVALQTPTTNSGIYAAWTIPPWDFGTTLEYPTLT